MTALAARLRHRVIIKSLAVTQNQTTGEVVESWSVAYQDVPAEVLTGPGKEPLIDNAKRSEVDARITTRWFNAAISDLYKMRIDWDGQMFEIIGVMTDATAREWFRLECKAVGDG